eukprot:TRINITY_DN73110_c0_g1_i1.p1 TRINITY_DN73110_c0_g1~~TRINITY_DN73110_c0_g1_i1.p1  ORF type:complete len:237 (-),score=46.49 TRINITY_DN73110_c0_g1_i1:13-723(-)
MRRTLNRTLLPVLLLSGALLNSTLISRLKWLFEPAFCGLPLTCPQSSLADVPALGRRRFGFWAVAPFLLKPSPALGEAGSDEEAQLVPPGTVLLRIAEVTDKQEGLLRRMAVPDSDLKVVRGAFTKSVEVMLRKSRLEEQLQELAQNEIPAELRPRAQTALLACLQALRRISVLDMGGSSPELSLEELLGMAELYSNAREQLRLFFELLPATTQESSRKSARSIREREQRLLESGL